MDRDIRRNFRHSNYVLRDINFVGHQISRSFQRLKGVSLLYFPLLGASVMFMIAQVYARLTTQAPAGLAE